MASPLAGTEIIGLTAKIGLSQGTISINMFGHSPRTIGTAAIEGPKNVNSNII